jgi:hypothetical protein
MPFPFLAPLSPWITDIMKQRESSPLMTSFKSPWVILTSPALVVHGTADMDINARRDELKKIISAGGGDKSFKGCIIANNSHNLNLTYATGNTPVGIDFTGKVITVEGESGRKVSTPIVESVDIDTDGANNTLKTAKINVRCFTLKQLEMFELFFMKPGMNILVEWGDTSLMKKSLFAESSVNSPQNEKRKYNALKNGILTPIKAFDTPFEALVPKTADYDNFCESFSKYYRSDTTAIAEYLGRVEQSLGTYDLVAGKVMDYSFEINDDGTYGVSLEISQGNQVSLAIPHSKTKTNSQDKIKPLDKEYPGPDQIKQLIIADFNLDEKTFLDKIALGTHPIPGGKWENDWFNFLKINKQQSDTIISDTAYVSLRFILQILMNYVIPNKNIDDEFFKFNLPTYKNKDGKELKILPVTSNRYIMSSSDKVIFPTDTLPKIYAPAKPKEGEEPKEGENVIKIIPNEYREGRINGYNFHSEEKLIVPNDPTNQSIIPEGDSKLGDALNVFIKYEDVVKAWNSTYTRIDFLEKILNTVNENGYGLFTLIYGNIADNSGASVIDAKMTSADNEVIKQNEKDIYRFKPTTINSNVKQFSFNFEMSNLVAGRQIFNSGKLLEDARKEQPNADDSKLVMPASAYKSIDNATMGNSDGWYSINNVELKRITANFEKAKAAAVAGKPQTDTPAKKSTTEATDFTQIASTKSINFYLDSKKSNGPKDATVLVYKDSDLIYNAVNGILGVVGGTPRAKKSTLSPIEVSITIDGFSGFSPGQYFKIDGIPEIYNQTGVFQITNIKHNVAPDGWNTTIEAGFRIVENKKEEPKK